MTTFTTATSRTGPAAGGVSVAELRAAWQAVTDGHFRHAATPPRSTRPGPPGRERRDRSGDGLVALEPAGGCPPVLVAVLGCHGSAGASTLALAVATAADRPVRVVDTAGVSRSGLSGAATAELGPTGTGWVRGHRGQVVLDRLADDHPGPAHLPALVPYPHPGAGLGPGPACRVSEQVPVVLDAGWDVHVLVRAGGGWLGAALASSRVLVLVTTATVPGMTRLDAALHTLPALGPRPVDRPVVVAVRGPVRRRWPRQVSGAPGPEARDLLDRSLVVVPHSSALAVRGLDTEPLPVPLVDAGARILALTGTGPDDAPTPATATTAKTAITTADSTARPGAGLVIHDEAPHHHPEGDTHVR